MSSLLQRLNPLSRATYERVTDIELEASDNSNHHVRASGALAQLPLEVFTKVLMECDGPTIAKLGRTSRYTRQSMQAAGSVFWLKAADQLGPIRADAAGMTARAERLEGRMSSRMRAAVIGGTALSLFAVDVGLTLFLAPTCKQSIADCPPESVRCIDDAKSRCAGDRSFALGFGIGWGGAMALVVGVAVGSAVAEQTAQFRRRLAYRLPAPPSADTAQKLFESRAAVMTALGAEFKQAVLADNARDVRRMLRSGFVPSAACREDFVPLTQALRTGAFHIASELVTYGVQPHDPLTLETLLQHGLQKRLPAGFHTWNSAPYPLFERLLKGGAPVTANAMKWAIDNDRPDVFEDLCAHIADPKALLTKLPQQTLLIDALQRVSSDTIIEALINLGVSVDPEGLEATSPLLVAVAMERVKVVDLLLSHGARTDVQDAEGRDVVALARLHKSAFPFAGLALGV